MKITFNKVSFISIMMTALVLCSTSVMADGTARANETKAPVYDVYLTNEFVNSQPSKTVRLEEFGCSDRIYAVMVATGLPREDLKLSVHWFDPTDKQIEQTDRDFSGGYRNRLWSWIQLHPPSGAFLGQMFDPSFGMEGFIGDWRVEFKINDKKVKELTFRVLC